MSDANTRDVGAFLIRIRDVMEANQQVLDELDAVAADGDHGATMVMGWRNVANAVAADPDRPIGRLLKDAGGAFADVGGSIGPLWGTALLRAGRVIGDVDRVTLSLAAQAVSAAVDGVAERGRCQEGDKTLLDVLAPASRALLVASTDADSVNEAVACARDAADSALAATCNMSATRGRARRLSERSLGHADPGAASAYLIWCTAVEAVAGRNSAEIILPSESWRSHERSPRETPGG